jgi:serine/threonine protein kinase
MGTVYKARHRLMDRLVALKMMNAQLLAKPAAVERFVREMKTAAQLVHPHIVTAYDAERVADMHFLVMEFVEGKTLAHVVLERGALPVHQACDYVRQAALGLQHASERRMAHRDIKPHNLILTNAGQVKILDFGLARFLSESGQPGEHTAFGTLMGSPDYMAPEQARRWRSSAPIWSARRRPWPGSAPTCPKVCGPLSSG